MALRWDARPTTPTRQMLAPLMLVAYATLGTMLACEIAMAVALPDAWPWIPRALTIALTTLGATVAGYVVLRNRHRRDEPAVPAREESWRLGAHAEDSEQLRRDLRQERDQRRRIETALRTSEARAAAFLESAAEGVLVADTRGTIVFANKRIEEMFGYPRDELNGCALELLMPDRVRRAHTRHREGYFATPRIRPMGSGLTLVGQRRDGTEFPIEVSLSFIESDDGTLAMGFVSDISERRSAEQALSAARHAAQQRERLADIGALTAKIVHDLGNPIAGLSMSVQRVARRLARNTGDPLESIRGPLEHMTNAVRHLDALTHEFKTFLREQRLAPAAIDLRTFLAETVAAWQPEAEQRGINLALHVPEGGDAVIEGDPDQLRRMFDNLVKNSLEAIGDGPGAITIAARVAEPDSVRISVADSGPGIPRDANVFALFETTKENGTGLGLPIAKQIAEAHGGGIEFASVDPHGVAFHVDIPRQSPSLQRDRDHRN